MCVYQVGHVPDDAPDCFNQKAVNGERCNRHNCQKPVRGPRVEEAAMLGGGDVCSDDLEDQHAVATPQKPKMSGGEGEEGMNGSDELEGGAGRVKTGLTVGAEGADDGG